MIRRTLAALRSLFGNGRPDDLMAQLAAVGVVPEPTPAPAGPTPIYDAALKAWCRQVVERLAAPIWAALDAIDTRLANACNDTEEDR